MSLPPDESSQTDVPSTHTASWWETLFTTPLSDVIRGDWSSRYKQLLRSSALPPTIAERISRIVRKASLWRNERNDVTRELIAHFQEGLDRGVSAALLVEQFGDVKTTARLIRRAKLRKRPIWWKTWYGVSRTIVAVLAILMVVYVVQAVRFFTGKPAITRNIIKELNDQVRKIPVEDRAWPLYVEAMKDFPKWPKGLVKFDDVNTQTKEWSEIVKIVHANKDRIEAIRKAAAKPHLGRLWGDVNDPAFQLTEEQDKRFFGVKPDVKCLEAANPFLLGISDTTAPLIYEVARLLHLAANVSADESDSEQVFLDIKATFDLSEQMFDVNDNRSLISQLVGTAIFEYTSRLLLNIVAEYPDLLSAAQMQDLICQIRAFNGGRVIRNSYDAEMLMFEDVLQRIYTAGPNGVYCYQGWRLLKGWAAGFDQTQESLRQNNVYLGPIAMTFAVNRTRADSEYNKAMNRWISEFRARPWEWTFSEEDDRLLDRCFLVFSRNPVARFCYPGVRSLTERAETTELQRSTMLIVLALNLFKLENGNWPNQLSEIAPRFLSSIPLDPNDGQPLRYKLTQSGPIVYSIGEDRHDDGGRATLIQMEGRDRLTIGYMNPEKRDAIHNNPNDPRNGDWILWPPVEKKGK